MNQFDTPTNMSMPVPPPPPAPGTMVNPSLNSAGQVAQTPFVSAPPAMAGPVMPTIQPAIVEDGQAENKKNDKKNSKKKHGIPPLLLIVLHLVIIGGVGVGVYLLWQNQNDQIVNLRSTVTSRNSEITRLQSELQKTQDSLMLNQKMPVYVDANGAFSFFQEIPGLTVTAKDGVVTATYGETNADGPVNGLVIKIQEQKTNGLGLAKIVDEKFAQKIADEENLDKRPEMFADKIGFSFVKVSDQREEINYFLQKNTQSNNYVLASYVIKAANEGDYANFEKVALEILNSLKIY